MQSRNVNLSSKLPQSLRHAIGRAINSILQMFDLQIVRKTWAVTPIFAPPRDKTAVPNRSSRPEHLVCPIGSGSACNDVTVPFGMVIPSVYGPVIVNRHDINQTNALVRTGKAFHHHEIMILSEFLIDAPDGAVCLDIGANFGLYALAFARMLGPKSGACHAFEAQRIIASMIAGTAALNGIENLYVHHAAVGSQCTPIPIPGFDYNKELNFGSVEFGREQREALSQDRVDGNTPDMVKQVRIDDLNLRNVHLIKIDIEGMEENALEGARETIARDLPLMCIEWIKSDKEAIMGFCKGLGFNVFAWGADLLCIHSSKMARYAVNIEALRL